MPALPQAFADWKTPPRYELRTSIGTGSYGHVCEAYDTEKERLVAIKRCTRVFEDLIDCKRLLREVAILSQLDHPTVVKLHDFFIPEPYGKFDELYMVLEICDSDFKKLVRTPVHLTELHIITIFYNLLCGIKYLSKSGIYHRDLKPANCLVNQNCMVKICDFGLSRAAQVDQKNLGELPVTPREEEGKGGAKPAVPHTKNMKRALTGHVVTRWYRAPELILLEPNYDEQIDIWSAGCILAELLGMMKENCAQHSDRGPLFPGQSCFPLSPDNKSSKKFSRGNRDQLKMIFDVIGTPTDEEIDSLVKDAAAYVRKQYQPKAGEDMQKRFPGASPATVDLLAKTLFFDPKKRIRIDDALAHPCFQEVQSNASQGMEKTARVDLAFDQEPELDERTLRRYFLQNLKRFRPETNIPPELA
jgi:mitogen-activated protein kinase 1/3